MALLSQVARMWQVLVLCFQPAEKDYIVQIKLAQVPGRCPNMCKRGKYDLIMITAENNVTFIV